MTIDDDRRRLQRLVAEGDAIAEQKLIALEERIGVRKRRNYVEELDEFLETKLDYRAELGASRYATAMYGLREDRIKKPNLRFFDAADIKQLVRHVLLSPRPEGIGWAWTRSAIYLSVEVPRQFISLVVADATDVTIGFSFWDGRTPELVGRPTFGDLTLPSRVWHELHPWVAHEHPANVLRPPFEVHERAVVALTGPCGRCGIADNNRAAREALDTRMRVWTLGAEEDVVERGVFKLPVRDAVAFLGDL